MNEIIPTDIKKTTKMADETFGRLLNIARIQKNVDYEEGAYFVMPKDPRGQQLIQLREAADARAKEIEAEFANLTSVAM